MLIDSDGYISLPPFRRRGVRDLFLRLLAVLAETAGDPDPQRIAAALGDPCGRVRRAVAVSVADAAADPTSISARRRCAYRLAANRSRLLRGWACPPGDFAAGRYAAAVIIGTEARRGKDEQRMSVKIAYRVLTGRSAAMQVFSRSGSSTVMALFGTLTEWPRGCRPYTPQLLVGLECALSLQREMGSLEVERVGVSRPQLAKNRKLTRQRFRSNEDCFFGFGVDCAVCAVGRSECYRSVRPIDTDIVAELLGQ